MMSDIAKHLGVSKTTVSRAFSGDGRISAKTKERILKYADEVGYFPNAAARNLATARTKNIAFSMPLSRDSTRSAYFLQCLFGAKKVASQYGYDVIIEGDKLEPISRIVYSRKADGVILTRNIIGNAALERLSESGIPIALTGSTPVENIIKVGYDGRAACKDLTMRLLERWPGDFGLIITQQEYPVNQMRAQGFCDAFTCLGLPLPYISWDVDTEEEAANAFRNMYNRGIRNIVCGDDVICQYMLIVQNTLKGSLSDKINIASFYSNHHLETFHPDIPVVQMEPQRLGEIACNMLIQRIEGNDVSLSTVLDYNLRL